MLFSSELASAPEYTGTVTLFYLDAHWGKRLPLADEMRVVAGAFPRCVIAIDDFMVPDDPGYAFDDYGPGKRLDLDYVKRSGSRTSPYSFLRCRAQTRMARGVDVL